MSETSDKPNDYLHMTTTYTEKLIFDSDTSKSGMNSSDALTDIGTKYRNQIVEERTKAEQEQRPLSNRLSYQRVDLERKSHSFVVSIAAMRDEESTDSELSEKPPIKSARSDPQRQN